MLLAFEFPPTSAEWTFFVATAVILISPVQGKPCEERAHDPLDPRVAVATRPRAGVRLVTGTATLVGRRRSA